MCWRISKTRTFPPEPKGVVTNHYKAESAATAAGGAIGSAAGGPLGGITGAGIASGLHRVFWENERTKYKIQTDTIVAESAQNAARTQEVRDITITASVTAALFAGIKKVIWG